MKVRQSDSSLGPFTANKSSSAFRSTANIAVQKSEQIAVGTKALANYNRDMARGWESKSVEAQQAEAVDKSAPRRPKMSATEAAASREKESLRLSRQRVLQQIEASSNPRHRKLLEDALTDLEAELRRLEE